ncbi:MAG: hypothetical protein GF421_05815 [Candidatus Aminicenantes bacterium]|nr:hypothetical protein [Candidatus Aminicenantes bacterium]
MILSPLTGGYHFAQSVRTANKKKDFMQTIIYVNPPFKGEDLDSVKISALNTRSVFTEIDHSYVNPIAEDFKKDIRNAMQNFKKWNNGNSGYPNPMLTFYEYMTWSVFNLYAWDTYDRDAFEYINQNTENNMMENRRFIKFREFNRQLLHLYQNKIKTQTIADLFPQMITWMENQ